MEWVVTTGRTVEEAKDAALDELGVDEQDAEFEVLEQPRQGLFGRQRGEARVRARVRPSVPRPKTDRRDRRRRRGEGTNARSSGESDAAAEDGETPDGADQGKPRPARGARGTAAGGGRAGKPAAAVVASAGMTADDEAGDEAGAGDGAGPSGGGSSGADATADADGPTTAGRGRRRRRRRGSGARSPEGAADAVDGPFADDTDADDDDEADDDSANGGTDVGEQELDLAQQGEVAETFVRGLLEKFELAADTTTTTVDEETLEVAVTGADLGLLIGQKGQTLQAMQELTRTVVQRRASNRIGRILVDVAGYRVRRREALERFTRQVAEDVRTSGVQRALEPMSAADRKVVHDTANDLAGVRTVSEGEEPRRRVVIVPADDAEADAG
jgi:spoIIIJ-associated protein